MSLDAVGTLPLAAFVLVPELLVKQWPAETRSDCSACPMTHSDPADPGRPVFTEKARCCTYQPEVPNFLVGRALRRKISSKKIVEHVNAGARVSPGGVQPSLKMEEAFETRGPNDFGRNLELRCPYWVGGELACGIWADRNAVCRSWHCRHVHGRAGLSLWTILGRTLQRVEELLAMRCTEVGKPPTHPAPWKAWEDWFEWCADYVERLEPQDLEPLCADVELTALRERLRRSVDELDQRVPEVLTPVLHEVLDLGDRVRLVGYSPYQGLLAPKAVFTFLAKCDGTRTWHRARLETAAETGTELSEVLIRTMFRLGMLGVPRDEGDDDGPEEAVIIGRRPEAPTEGA